MVTVFHQRQHHVVVNQTIDDALCVSVGHRSVGHALDNDYWYAEAKRGVEKIMLGAIAEEIGVEAIVWTAVFAGDLDCLAGIDASARLGRQRRIKTASP